MLDLKSRSLSSREVNFNGRVRYRFFVSSDPFPWLGFWRGLSSTDGQGSRRAYYTGFLPE